jgi:hypothetical protein
MATRKNNRKEKKQSRRRRYNKRTIKGGCGCGAKHDVTPATPFKLFGGSVDKFLGNNAEPASFREVPIHNFYPQNMYAQGSDVQGAQIASRLEPTIKGGKRKNRKGKSKAKRTRKINGGGGITYAGLPSTNIISSAGTPAGALHGYNIYGENTTVNGMSYPLTLPKTAMLV